MDLRQVFSLTAYGHGTNRCIENKVLEVRFTKNFFFFFMATCYNPLKQFLCFKHILKRNAPFIVFKNPMFRYSGNRFYIGIVHVIFELKTNFVISSLWACGQNICIDNTVQDKRSTEKFLFFFFIVTCLKPIEAIPRF